MSASTHIVSRLAKRFSNAVNDRDKPDYLTRDIGGHFRNNQPYISGYFQIVCGLPEELFGGAENVKTASQWLHSTCEGFTPHTQTLNTVDIQGQGQIGSSFVASVSTSREFTLTFREYQNLPILNIMRRWASVMDPFVGASPLDGNRIVPWNYKGWIAVIQMKPTLGNDVMVTGEDIEEGYIYQGVTPTNIPIDTASATDITSNETVQLSCTFKFDGAPMTTAEPDVNTKLVELLADMKMLGETHQGGDKTTYNQYWSIATGATTSQWGTHDGDNKTAPSTDAKNDSSAKLAGGGGGAA